MFLYNSWRIFLAICSIPSVLVAVFLFFLPESPKYLLTRNEHQKALEVFKQIYATNTGNDPEMYPVSFVSVDIEYYIISCCIFDTIICKKKKCSFIMSYYKS